MLSRRQLMIAAAAAVWLFSRHAFAGRALLWDLSLDRSAQSGYREAKVAQMPYVYQTKSDQ